MIWELDNAADLIFYSDPELVYLVREAILVHFTEFTVIDFCIW